MTSSAAGSSPAMRSTAPGSTACRICQIDDPENCIDQATLGGFGSALTYTGHDNVFLAVPDRGPFDGRTDVPYFDRFHFLLHHGRSGGAPFPNIRTVLLDTRFLPQRAQSSTSSAAPRPSRATTPAPCASIPRASASALTEPLRVGRGTGRRSSSSIARAICSGVSPCPRSSSWQSDRRRGYSRQLVGAVSGLQHLRPTGQSRHGGPDDHAGRRTLVGMMQNALIQDHGLDQRDAPGRVGFNNRIITYDLKTGASHEYVYVLDAVDQGRGVNEILAVNDQSSWCSSATTAAGAHPPNDEPAPQPEADLPDRSEQAGIDRRLGGRAVCRRPGRARRDIVPVTKSLFLDLLDPSYKVNATQTIKDVIAEKIEAWPGVPTCRMAGTCSMSSATTISSRPTDADLRVRRGRRGGANVSYQAAAH